MEFDKVLKILKTFSSESLLGKKAHEEISPYRDSITPLSSPRIAAVLILLYPINEITHFALIQRPTYNGKHSGQISLPGGKQEIEDISLIDTATREAWEETNIESSMVNIIGELTQIFIPPSNFKVTPFLATALERPNFKPDNREVAEILEVKLQDLIKPFSLKQKDLQRAEGETLNTSFFELQSKTVWGATAMILNELRHFIISKSEVKHKRKME